MMPATLDDDRLYVFLFGPGLGESVLVRVPPNHWIVIDSCRVAARAAALHVIERFNGETSCAVLTHPHRDHYRDFSQVLEFRPWGIVGCSDLRLEGDDVDLSIDPERRRENELEQILAMITDSWRRNKASQWWTWRGTDRRIGDATMVSLHPTEQFVKSNPKAKINNLSSAILLEWRGVRLLLGADVENPHWEDIAVEFQRIETHAAMKVPHHGSRGAIPAKVLPGERSRLWLVTPYNLGEKLPRFDDGHGPHKLLDHVDRLHVTGLPIAHDRQNEAPCQATRQELFEGVSPAALTFELPGGLVGETLPIREDLSCYVVCEFDETGRGQVITYGPGSICVTEAGNDSEHSGEGGVQP